MQQSVFTMMFDLWQLTYETKDYITSFSASLDLFFGWHTIVIIKPKEDLKQSRRLGLRRNCNTH